tara:strand:- start:3370 stop:3498 length:129 start_codon:yes stop_codon:yes gene_type:complete
MELSQYNNLNYWGIWLPIIGGILLYVGLNLKVTEIDPNDEKR